MAIVVEPEVIVEGVVHGRWMVIVFNDEIHTQDEVIEILMRSTGCGVSEAITEIWEAEEYGKTPVHFAGRTECEIVAGMISSIGVRTVVRPEWNE